MSLLTGVQCQFLTNSLPFISCFSLTKVYSLLVAIVAEIGPKGGADVDNIDQRGIIGEGTKSSEAMQWSSQAPPMSSRKAFGGMAI